LDQIFDGVSLGAGTVNGRTLTASAALRSFSITCAMLVNNQVGSFADFLNRVPVSILGGLLRDVGLPENWITANPQFAAADFVGNFSNSTYHSLQINANKRFRGGWSLLSNYTLSRSISNLDKGNNSQLLRQS